MLALAVVVQFHQIDIIYNNYIAFYTNLIKKKRQKLHKHIHKIVNGARLASGRRSNWLTFNRIGRSEIDAADMSLGGRRNEKLPSLGLKQLAISS